MQWLKSLYQEVPEGCPEAKRVKVSDIHKQLEDRYAKCSHKKVSEIIQRAFPNAETKTATKTRTMHVFGITPVNEASSSQQTITQMLESERAVNRDLLGKIQVLEAKIQELERTSVGNLVQQAQALPHTSLTACGPDSYEHFHGFSIDGVICELKEQLPDLYALVMQLADVKRNVEVPNTVQVKAVSALCTLLNARSSRVKGMQLLLSTGLPTLRH